MANRNATVDAQRFIDAADQAKAFNFPDVIYQRNIESALNIYLENSLYKEAQNLINGSGCNNLSILIISYLKAHPVKKRILVKSEVSVDASLENILRHANDISLRSKYKIGLVGDSYSFRKEHIFRYLA